MKLYELTESFTELFSRFEGINEYEPDTDADGQPIDDNGDIIEDVEAYKEKMLTAWFDTLEGIEGEFDEKAENIAIYIKQLKAEANILKFEKSAIATGTMSAFAFFAMAANPLLISSSFP